MMLTLMMAIAVAAPNPGSIDAPRKAYSACLKSFETKSMADKLAPAEYSEALKSACAAEASKLMSALIAYDVAMGTKRPAAMSNAETDLGDYRTISEERYKDMNTPQ